MIPKSVFILQMPVQNIRRATAKKSVFKDFTCHIYNNYLKKTLRFTSTKFLVKN